MKIAAAQIACALGDFKANLEKIRDFSARARDAGAELIVFPEMVDTGYAMPIIADKATAWSEGAVPKLQEIAKAVSITVIAGVSEREGSSIYNAQAVISANGKIVAKYRKTHLFAVAPLQEDKCFTAGNELASFTIEGFRFGLSICYDLRFPDLYQTLSVRDSVNAFIVSSAWPFPRLEHFRALALARAIENQSYIVSANRVGKDDGIPFCGTSMIVDPYGAIIASASADREELLCGEISDAVVQSVRNRMPIFKHRRPDLYQTRS